ncbi:MAG: HAD-IIIA family hydrolase [Actinobacteria bacterium]|nr:HAD-IIIA family hydrolase [Actinomycetota bacterium]
MARILSQLPVMLVVVSNQAGIAKGLFSADDMAEFNRELRRRVGAAGGRLDAFYFCPDLEPIDLQPGAAASPCAKPAPGMLLEAAADYNLDLRRSFLIGDKASDVAAGRSAGCSPFLVETGMAGREAGAPAVVPDRRARDVLDAARAVSAELTPSRAASR